MACGGRVVLSNINLVVGKQVSEIPFTGFLRLVFRVPLLTQKTSFTPQPTGQTPCRQIQDEHQAEGASRLSQIVKRRP